MFNFVNEAPNRGEQVKFANDILKMIFLGLSLGSSTWFILDQHAVSGFTLSVSIVAIVLGLGTFVIFNKYADSHHLEKIHLIALLWPLLEILSIYKNGYLPTPYLPLFTLIVSLAYRGRYRLLSPYLFVGLSGLALFFSESFSHQEMSYRTILMALFIIFPINFALDYLQNYKRHKKIIINYVFVATLVVPLLLVSLSYMMNEVFFVGPFILVMVSFAYWVISHFLLKLSTDQIGRYLVFLMASTFIYVSIIQDFRVAILYPAMILVSFLLTSRSEAITISFFMLIYAANLSLDYQVEGFNKLAFYTRYVISNTIFISALALMSKKFLDVNVQVQEFDQPLLNVISSYLFSFFAVVFILFLANGGWGVANISDILIDSERNAFSLNFTLLISLTWMLANFWLQFKNNQQMSAKLFAQKELLETSNKQLVLALQSQERFMGKINYELRTPLNGILDCINIIESHDLKDNTRNFLRITKNSSAHLLNMVEEVLDAVALKEQTFTLKHETVLLHELLTDCLDLSKSQCIKPLNFSLQIHQNVPEKIIGDSRRLKQIVNNLLSNAIKFSQSGSVGLQCEISNANPPMITIVVKDSGIGIKEDALQIIFEAFKQLSEGDHRTHKGLGIGLTLVKDLVHKMHGNVHVKSFPGQGSEFTVSIPLERS